MRSMSVAIDSENAAAESWKAAKRPSITTVSAGWISRPGNGAGRAGSHPRAAPSPPGERPQTERYQRRSADSQAATPHTAATDSAAIA
jgi:hypothetical protein